MGLIYANVELANADDIALAGRGYIEEINIKRIKVKALVDSGAYILAINENIKTQLQLRVVDKSPATLADGSVMELEVAGPVEIRFANRRAIVDAMVLLGSSEVLLGTIPMEAMDVVINPLKQEMTVNPEHPLKAQFSLK